MPHPVKVPKKKKKKTRIAKTGDQFGGTPRQRIAKVRPKTRFA